MKGNRQKIHRIELPVPFPVKTVNAYLVEEEPITLIDTGVRTDTSFHALRDSLGRLGYGIKDIRRILITHGHLDHYGQARRLSDLSGADIYIHVEEYERIRSLVQFRRDVASMLMQNGTPKGSVDKTVHYMQWAHQLAEPLEDVHFMSEGEKICSTKAVLRPIHCPGHSPGLFCFYLEEEAILISGDHLLKEISPNPIFNPTRKGLGPRATSLKHYLNSIRKIQDLEVSLVLPGHGEPMWNFRAAVEKVLHHHEERLGAVLSVLSRGEKTAYDISRVLFPNTESFQVFLGVSEVLGHLDILLEEGRITLSSRNEIDYYSLN